MLGDVPAREVRPVPASRSHPPRTSERRMQETAAGIQQAPVPARSSRDVARHPSGMGACRCEPLSLAGYGSGSAGRGRVPSNHEGGSVEIHEEFETSGLMRPAPVPLPTRRRNRLDVRHAPGITATGPDAIPHSCSVKAVWIPAFAGMTVGGVPAGAVRTIIPAFAGMTAIIVRRALLFVIPAKAGIHVFCGVSCRVLALTDHGRALPDIASRARPGNPRHRVSWR